MASNSDVLNALSARMRASQGLGEVVTYPVPTMLRPVVTERVVPPPGAVETADEEVPAKRKRRTPAEMAEVRAAAAAAALAAESAAAVDVSADQPNEAEPAEET